MNIIYGFVLTLVCVGVSAQNRLKCTVPAGKDIPTAWLDMVDPCINSMKSQVQTEIDASITYLAMAAHFARDSKNRPGFSEMFFKSASEEREHALKIIEYLLMRGELTSDVSKLLKFPLKPLRQEWATGLDALSDALTLEAQVTRSIRAIIEVCEKASTNDYHLVDYLTADFLDEQYKGQRDLAGKMSTLGKMMVHHGPLGEYLFDKKLQNNEL